jgi:hypothetical protein
MPRMRRSCLGLGLLLALVLAVPLASCGRASSEDCRKAVMNLLHIRGLDTSDHATDPEAEIRKCRATADPKQVACLIAAQTDADVAACEHPK